MKKSRDKLQLDKHNDYIITSTEGTERGLFFRSPIQNVQFDVDYYGPRLSAWDYQHKIKNPIRRFYEILIGNRKIVKNIDAWADDFNFAGFNANILCFPIYFKREYRQLSVYSCDNTTDIQSIYSHGYESEFNFCSGECVVEKTTIKLKNGKQLKFKKFEQYHFTYTHIIKRVLDDGLNKEDVSH